jgi:DnaJ-class molecular chaperone
MKRLMLVLSLMLFTIYGCGQGGDSNNTETPLHLDDQAGVLHASGKETPLESCSSCHGDDLRGDDATSCYDCHTSEDHGVPISRVMHMAFSVDCDTCHGPDNSGGIGPACATCHEN